MMSEVCPFMEKTRVVSFGVGFMMPLVIFGKCMITNFAGNRIIVKSVSFVICMHNSFVLDDVTFTH